MHAITRSGWIEVISGSMFSGKTEELLRRLRRSEIAGQSVAVYKPAVDDRYGETTIGSHNNGPVGGDRRRQRGWRPACNPRRRAVPEVVAIDEANFFSDALVEVCNALADNGTRVIVSGTDQTFRGEPFEPAGADGDRRVRRQATSDLLAVRRARLPEPAPHRGPAGPRRRSDDPVGGVLRGAVS